MSIVELVIWGFIVMELTNVLTLYFNPGSKQFNGIGVFNAWEKSKQDPEVHRLVQYLINWVAGVKLIFIMLLVVILLTTGPDIQRLTLLALIVSVVSFFWRLFPLARKMDRDGQLSPKNYSTILGGMIFAFIVIFTVAYLL